MTTTKRRTQAAEVAVRARWDAEWDAFWDAVSRAQGCLTARRVLLAAAEHGHGPFCEDDGALDGYAGADPPGTEVSKEEDEAWGEWFDTFYAATDGTGIGEEPSASALLSWPHLLPEPPPEPMPLRPACLDYIDSWKRGKPGVNPTKEEANAAFTVLLLCNAEAVRGCRRSREAGVSCIRSTSRT